MGEIKACNCLHEYLVVACMLFAMLTCSIFSLAYVQQIHQLATLLSSHTQAFHGAGGQRGVCLRMYACHVLFATCLRLQLGHVAK